MTTAQNLAGLSQVVSAYNSSLGNRNRIINGCMRVGQRGSTTHTSGSIAYGAADRWYVYTAGSNITSDNAWNSPPSKAALHLAGATGNTATTVGHRIESANIWDMAGQTMTLSAYIWSSTGNIPQIAIGTPSAVDNFSTVNWGTLVPSLASLTASTWTRFTYSFVVPAGATNGLDIEIQFGANVSGQQMAISGVQLEPGPVATNFELRPLAHEVVSCQRYYQYYPIWKFWQTSAASGLPVGQTVNFPAMRTTPSVAYSSVTYSFSSGLTFEQVSNDSVAFYATTNSSGSNGASVAISGVSLSAEI